MTASVVLYIAKYMVVSSRIPRSPPFATSFMVLLRVSFPVHRNLWSFALLFVILAESEGTGLHPIGRRAATRKKAGSGTGGQDERCS